MILLTGLVGCGGDQGAVDPASPVPPEAWVSGTCNAVADWLDEIKGLSDFLPENIDQSSVEAAKGSVLGFLDQVLAATDQMIQEVEAAGVPDVKDGEAAVDQLMSGLREVRSTLERARSRTAALPTDDMETFGSGVSSIGEDLQNSGDAIASAFQGFTGSELDALANDSPACQELTAA